MIEFTNVSVDVDEYDVEGRHRRVKILSTVNLIVPERRVAVIGPNGAGKSTFSNSLTG
ncbi:ATPase component BioM of energizing module of biotin ECF transporter [Cutibacterium acnes JCM 18909]|nr:ATPase component BioM of energizing module of biotin ECF transporter [Cutibacterium acnes JCM 18909]